MTTSHIPDRDRLVEALRKIHETAGKYRDAEFVAIANEVTRALRLDAPLTKIAASDGEDGT